MNRCQFCRKESSDVEYRPVHNMMLCDKCKNYKDKYSTVVHELSEEKTDKS